MAIDTRPPAAGLSDPGAVTANAGATLPRRLGAWSAGAVVVGLIVGSGIFRVPAQVAREVPGAWTALLLWAVGGAIALAGALAIAELAAMLPRAGGIYAFIRETYGPVPAFLFGWTDFLIVRPGSVAALGLISAGYMSTFVPLDGTAQRWVAALLAVLLAAAQYRSVLLGAAVQNASSLLKAGALLVLALLLFALGDGSAGSFAEPSTLRALTPAGLGVALIAILWAYDGWADVAALGGEVKDPGRALPRAILGGMAAVLVIYLAINAAYLYVLPLAATAASPLVAADAATRVFGRAGASVVAALVIIATFGSANAVMMTGPRFIFAMAADGLFFRRLAAVHPRYGTPHVAIAATGALSVLYATSRSFEQLTAAIILGEWPFYTLAVLAVILLRRRDPERPRPYRSPFFPLLPVVFVIASLALMAGALVSDTALTMLSFGIILSGLPAYWLWRRYGARFRNSASSR
jgi:amino acid transporter